MGEKFRPQQERAGATENELSGPEIISPGDVSSRITRTELARLISLNETILASDLPDGNKEEKRKQLDQISLNLTGHEVSTFGYYFPEESLFVAEKENYEMIGELDVGPVHIDFQILPEDKILVKQRVKGESYAYIHDILLGPSVRSTISTDDKFKHIQVLPNGNYIFSSEENGQLYEKDSEGKLAIIPVRKGPLFDRKMPYPFQVMSEDRVISKVGGALQVSEQKSDGNWQTARMIRLEEAPFDGKFRIFPDGKVMVLDKERVLTYQLDQEMNAKLISSTSFKEISPWGENVDRVDMISGNQIAIKRDPAIIICTLQNNGEWRFKSNFDPMLKELQDYRFLPNGNLLVLFKDGNIFELEMGHEGEGILKVDGEAYKKNIDQKPIHFDISPSGKIFIYYLLAHPGRRQYKICVFDGTPVEEESG